MYRHDGWGLGLLRAPIESLLDARPAKTIEWLPVARGHTFFADPFAIEQTGTRYCFFEELPYRSNRGKISFFALDGPDALTPYEALSLPYHLSYPFLLRHEGEILCIPEASASGRVAAYSARDFPHGWRERATLLENFPGVDPTLFEHEGRWWLFCTDGKQGWNADLYAWHAEDPFATWHPHARNPIKRDLAGSRPAGTPFRANGRLYRPGQNCADHYGAGVIFNEILELSPLHFREERVAVLEPVAGGPYPDGLHTVSACGDITVVDGNRLYFEPFQAVRTLGRYANKVRRAILRR
jgi:hypothetical protein